VSEELEGSEFGDKPFERKAVKYQRSTKIEKYLVAIAESNKPSAKISFDVLRNIGGYGKVSSDSRSIGKILNRLTNEGKIKFKTEVWVDPQENCVKFNIEQKPKSPSKK